MKTCIKKAWSTANPKDLHLVPEGDESAQILIAAPGTRVKDEALSAFPGKEVDKYFVDEKDYVPPAKSTSPIVVHTTQNITPGEDEDLVTLEKINDNPPAKGKGSGKAAKKK